MTLPYWWMHWFWITLGFSFVLSEELLLTPHSTLAEQSSPIRSGKSIGISIPPNNENPSNSSSIVNLNGSSPIKPQKPSSSKKIEFIYSNNMTTKLTNNATAVSITKNSFPKDHLSVINQNSSDFSIITTENQTLINSSLLSSINHTDSLNYINETNINQTLIQTEKITELTDAENKNDDDDVNGNLSAAGITGITLGCVVIVGAICGVSYFLYRNRGFNRPQVLNDRCSNPDSSGYIDDASVRDDVDDNSEEMYSLDNDSFLNSLEAMTIQNYWTDTVKHTKL